MIPLWLAQVEHARQLGLDYPTFLWWIEEGGGSRLYGWLLEAWALQAAQRAAAREAATDQAWAAQGWQGGACDPGPLLEAS